MKSLAELEAIREKHRKKLVFVIKRIKSGLSSVWQPVVLQQVQDLL